MEWDVKAEAQRLRNDPAHLRRKAAYIESQSRLSPDSPHADTRRRRVAELLAEASRLETVDPFAGIVDVEANDRWDT